MIGGGGAGPARVRGGVGRTRKRVSRRAALACWASTAFLPAAKAASRAGEAAESASEEPETLCRSVELAGEGEWIDRDRAGFGESRIETEES